MRLKDLEKEEVWPVECDLNNNILRKNMRRKGRMI